MKKNHQTPPTKILLLELEKKLTNNSFTEDEMLDLCRIFAENYHRIHPILTLRNKHTQMQNEELKRKLKDLEDNV
jgi:hypothetical protein